MRRRPTDDPPFVRVMLIGLALLAFALLIAAPGAIVFAGALRLGFGHFITAITDAATLGAIRLTLAVLAVAIPVNVVFGLAAAWAIARFEFPGRAALVTALDLPFVVSPVISGLVLVLVFGARAPLGRWLVTHHIQIVFATPGIVLATVLVTFPLVARELIPAFASLGRTVDEAALVSGATGWQLFTRVTLPSVRSALISSVALATARAAGEFGAVAVVSGHIAGRTNTLPLEIASRTDSGDVSGAFAIACLLMIGSALTLAVRWVADR